MGSHGHRVNFDAAHDSTFILNAIQGMGSVGTVFSLLFAGDDNISFPYKDVAQRARHSSVADSLYC